MEVNNTKNVYANNYIQQFLQCLLTDMLDNGILNYERKESAVPHLQIRKYMLKSKTIFSCWKKGSQPFL